MSKKPTLTIRYPEASEKALKLTEAMVKRSPGKRVVETESEDPIFPDGGDLFSSFIRCKTSTGVDLTLTLNQASMDFALETLIRPNLNAEERKQILGEDPASSEEALPGLAPTDDPTKEQKKQIEVGKLTDVDLRIILHDLIDCTQGYVSGGPDAYDEHIDSAIENAIKEIDHKAGVIDLNETYPAAAAQSGELEEQIQIGKISESDLRKLFLRLMEEEEQGVERESAIEDAINDVNDMIADAEWHPYQETKETQREAETQSVDQEKKLRKIINDMLERMEKGHGNFDAINHAIYEFKELTKSARPDHIELADVWIPQKIAAALCAAGCSKKSKLLDPFVRGLLVDLEIEDQKEEYYISLSVLIAIKKKMEEWKINDPFALYDQFQGSIPSWDDAEKEAQTIGQKSEEPSAPAEQSAAPRADVDIEPGLLNDLDTETEEKTDE